jgi:hypothetical protein
MTMITITGAVAEAVRSLVVLAEAVSEAEAVSVEAALAEEWAEAVVPVLVSKINVIQCPSFEIN